MKTKTVVIQKRKMIVTPLHAHFFLIVNSRLKILFARPKKTFYKKRFSSVKRLRSFWYDICVRNFHP